MFTFKSFNDLSEKIAKAIPKQSGKFSLKCKRTGTHPFKSVDVTQVWSQHIRDAGSHVDYENPETTFLCDIVDTTCLIGEILKEDLQKRSYRLKHNNKSINACIAAAMTYLSNPEKDETLLDPLCKDGIISLEAWMLGYRKMYVADPIKNNIRNAQINCKFAKTSMYPMVLDWDSLKKELPNGRVDHTITNIPISTKRKGDEVAAKRILKEIEEITRKTFTVVTTQPEVIKEISKQFVLDSETPVYVGEMKYAILSFKKMDQ